MTTAPVTDARNAPPSRLTRASCAAAAVIAALLLQSIYHQGAGWAPVLGLTGLALLAAARPFDALLVVAAAGPLAAMLQALAGHATAGIHVSEAMILATLTGAAARRAATSRSLAVSPWIVWCAAILIAAAMASALVQAGVLRAQQPDLSSWRIVRDHLVRSDTVTSAIQFAEGPLLLLAIADLCAANAARRERVLRMMVAGAAAAAALNILRIVTAALRQEHHWTALLTYVTYLRVNVHYGDLNAAGSYFAMMLIITVSLMARRWMAYGGCAALIGTGLWLTGSRTAFGAVVLTAVFAGVLAMRGRGIRRNAPVLAGLALLIVVAFAAWRWYPTGRNAAEGWSFSTRIELAKAGLRMTATQPLFGVGLGRFYVLSNQYAGPMLAAQGKEHENAHNYFVQVLAELGIPGLLLFLSLIVLVLREAWRRPGPLWGVIGGLVTYLVTCLGGHPLLVPDAAYPFWIATGLAAAPAALAARTMDRRARLAAMGLLGMLVVTVPWRMSGAVQHAHLENTTVGLSLWQHEPDGSRYRWAGGRATFFVPSSARAIRIPLRHGSDGPSTLEARIFLDGQEANRVLLHAAEAWHHVLLVLDRKVPGDFSRIDLEVRVPGAPAPLETPLSGTARVLMVGQPVIIGAQ